ncbi:MAG: ABC transporter ATP-binding protein [Pseudomonadota bacterium]
MSRSFVQAGARIDVLRSVDLALAAGEVAGLLGVSGSGKSTLLHLSGLLERPDSGEIVVLGETTAKRGDGQRTRLRREGIGFVYQFHHLLPEFSARENVALPMLIAGKRANEAQARAVDLLESVGLAARLDHRPSQLSGGEQQRVAIARALANHPSLVLADEPTGNLDEATAEAVFDGFLEALRAVGASALVATHDRRLAARLDRTYELRGGQLHPVG